MLNWDYFFELTDINLFVDDILIVLSDLFLIDISANNLNFNKLPQKLIYDFNEEIEYSTPETVAKFIKIKCISNSEGFNENIEEFNKLHEFNGILFMNNYYYIIVYFIFKYTNNLNLRSYFILLNFYDWGSSIVGVHSKITDKTKFVTDINKFKSKTLLNCEFFSFLKYDNENL